MDVALQRPIIVTTSASDRTIRVWNYLTGHCEYCKIILTEKEDDKEKELDILSVAIHPNGYYLAISDKEMIRFFHLCFKELRFYNNDIVGNDNAKANCHLLKFSYGGHLLAAVSGKTVYLIRSYTRETIREFKTLHSSIKSIAFDESDRFLYTVGQEGLVMEFNLFNFKGEEASTKYVSYSGGTVMPYGGNTRIISAGNLSSDKFILSNIEKVNEDKFSTEFINVDSHINSVCNLHTKKCDIYGLAAGTKDGTMMLYSYPLDETPWDKIKSHVGEIVAIHYSKDTNLLFSAGSDGNLFIYCVYEYQDNEHIVFEQSKTKNINQLNNILDEGLGDNVLFPLEKIFYFEKKIHEQSAIIAQSKHLEEKQVKDFEVRLRDKENELNRAREKEIKVLNDMIMQKSGELDALEHAKNEAIKKLIDENNKIMIEKEKSFNERMDQSANTIHELNSKIVLTKTECDRKIKLEKEMYERRISELESELRKKFDELKKRNKILTDEKTEREKMEELKFNQLDHEHEQEINYKHQKFDQKLTEMKDEKIKLNSEIAQYKDLIKIKEESLNENENILKKKTEII